LREGSRRKAVPKKFEDAVRAGKPVVTKKLPGGKYMHIAFLGPGKSVGGEIHTKKKKKGK
jgi:hypothetical protein